MSLCRVMIVGRLGAAPELRTSAAGNPWTTLSVATDRRKKQDGAWVDHTDWHRVTVFGDRAQACHRLLRKGSMIAVEGELEYDQWTDREGRVRFGVKVVGRQVTFLSRFGKEAEEVAAA